MRRLVLIVFGFYCCRAIEIDIVKTGKEISYIPIAINIKIEGSYGVTFLKTLCKDLEFSGWFRVKNEMPYSLLLNGSYNSSAGYPSVSVTLKSIANGSVYFSNVFSSEEGEILLAHLVTDAVVQAIKGVKGVMSAKITFIGKDASGQDIYICYPDGSGLKRITSDRVVCSRPRWTYDGREIVYTSFYKNFPDVYSIDITSWRRTRICSYPGLNAGAVVSPDKSKMALILSKDGNPEVYIHDLNTRKLQRLTFTPTSVEASPSWSFDGRNIVFVSDVTGRPHLYILPASGGTPIRITFWGSENVDPDWGPTGVIAYSSKRSGFYQICIVDPKDRKERQITNHPANCESPSWGRDGRHIVYTYNTVSKKELRILDIEDGKEVKLPLPLMCYSPDWVK